VCGVKKAGGGPTCWRAGGLAGDQLACWFAVVVVGPNAIDQMFFVGAYPFRPVMIIAVDVVALYGLCGYGSHQNLGARLGRYGQLGNGTAAPTPQGVTPPLRGLPRRGGPDPSRSCGRCGFATAAHDARVSPDG